MNLGALGMLQIGRMRKSSYVKNGGGAGAQAQGSENGRGKYARGRNKGTVLCLEN